MYFIGFLFLSVGHAACIAEQVEGGKILSFLCLFLHFLVSPQVARKLKLSHILWKVKQQSKHRTKTVKRLNRRNANCLQKIRNSHFLEVKISLVELLLSQK